VQACALYSRSTDRTHGGLTLLSEKEVVESLKKKLIEEGFEVRTKAVIFGDFEGDIVAKKEGKEHLIEVKMSRDQILSNLIEYRNLRHLPNISFLYLAIPDELLQNDVVAVAKQVHLGLYVVSENGIQLAVAAEEIPPGYLYFSGLLVPRLVSPGQTFEIAYEVPVQEKAFVQVEISYLAGGPFIIPGGESGSKLSKEVSPGTTLRGKLAVGVRKDARLGLYSLYLKITGNNKIVINEALVQVQEKNEESIRQVVSLAVDELNRSLTTNIDNALRQIEEGVENGVIDIEKNTTDYSIWNEIGSFSLSRGLFQEAEGVYKRMLLTIKREETKKGKPLHKGLAFYNLGLALYPQGKFDEAKDNFKNAYEEDKRTYGEKANTYLAFKALSTLFGPSPSKGSPDKPQ
jgi:hypothetical protein